jgi:hypothetical protein
LANSILSFCTHGTNVKHINQTDKSVFIYLKIFLC